MRIRIHARIGLHLDPDLTQGETFEEENPYFFFPAQPLLVHQEPALFLCIG